MKVLAVNAAWRKKGTTTRLVEKALEGAAAGGIETEMVLLSEKDIRPCTNCLKCYREIEPDLGPCSMDDDMTGILQKVMESDGLILASPIHNGFVSSLMVIFFERMVWRMCRPTRRIAVLKNCPNPRTPKVRALASIVSAGGIPERLRKYCDGTPWMRENAIDMFNGQWIGDLYAAAHMEHLPETDQDWRQMYFLRKLSNSQMEAARELGVKMAAAINGGNLKPSPTFGPATELVMKAVLSVGELYRKAD
jgi:multimeric flavodoxin WrbA